jgi:hypothetical protein
LLEGGILFGVILKRGYLFSFFWLQVDIFVVEKRLILLLFLLLLDDLCKFFTVIIVDDIIFIKMIPSEKPFLRWLLSLSNIFLYIEGMSLF